jgi:hypothetical protein
VQISIFVKNRSIAIPNAFGISIHPLPNALGISSALGSCTWRLHFRQQQSSRIVFRICPLETRSCCIRSMAWFAGVSHSWKCARINSSESNVVWQMGHLYVIWELNGAWCSILVALFSFGSQPFSTEALCKVEILRGEMWMDNTKLGGWKQPMCSNHYFAQSTTNEDLLLCGCVCLHASPSDAGKVPECRLIQDIVTE